MRYYEDQCSGHYHGPNFLFQTMLRRLDSVSLLRLLSSEIGYNSIYWAQQSRFFYLRDGDTVSETSFQVKN
jgi:hypothetical protein